MLRKLTAFVTLTVQGLLNTFYQTFCMRLYHLQKQSEEDDKLGLSF